MLGKCVLSVSGIVTKQIEKVDHHAGYDFYMLKTDIKNNNEYGMTFLEYDNHYFHLANNKERIKQYLDQNPDFNLIEMIITVFEKQLQSGQYINKGYAQFLGREAEAKQAAEAHIERKRIEREKKEKEQKQQELERLKAEQKRLAEVEKIYITGDRIKSHDFLSLCDEHNITVPIRTRGWIIGSLADIEHKDGVTRFSYAGNPSKSIGNVASDLYIALVDIKEGVLQ